MQTSTTAGKIKKGEDTETVALLDGWIPPFF
jgi:hypothetical protein